MKVLDLKIIVHVITLDLIQIQMYQNLSSPPSPAIG